MSTVVWSPENGWHDGADVTVSLDPAGRIVAEPINHVPSVPYPPARPSCSCGFVSTDDGPGLAQHLREVTR